jgi:hypothetical protein
MVRKLVEIVLACSMAVAFSACGGPAEQDEAASSESALNLGCRCTVSVLEDGTTVQMFFPSGCKPPVGAVPLGAVPQCTVMGPPPSSTL